jgi:hypothetical protein
MLRHERDDPPRRNFLHPVQLRAVPAETRATPQTMATRFSAHQEAEGFLNLHTTPCQASFAETPTNVLLSWRRSAPIETNGAILAGISPTRTNSGRDVKKTVPVPGREYGCCLCVHGLCREFGNLASHEHRPALFVFAKRRQFDLGLARISAMNRFAVVAKRLLREAFGIPCHLRPFRPGVAWVGMEEDPLDFEPIATLLKFGYTGKRTADG